MTRFKFPSTKLPTLAVPLAIGFGVLVRLVQYGANRSLWADEAPLALNIVERSYQELWQPLSYDQHAPLGFLMVEKFAVQLLGNNEYALRLVPLLCGIASLFLFYQLVKRTLPPKAVWIAVLLLASSSYLIYYAAEVKQYSSDVAIALFLTLMLVGLRKPDLSAREVGIAAACGAIAIWFSHPAIFVLAGLEASYLLVCLFKKSLIQPSRRVFIYALWLFSFAISYGVSLSKTSSREHLFESWEHGFPATWFDLNWLFESFTQALQKPFGFPDGIHWLAALAFAVGCVSLFFERRDSLLILISPVLTTLLAAYLYKYPFGGRLILFLTPFIAAIVAAGAEFIRRKVQVRLGSFVSFAFLSLLIFLPVVEAARLIVEPQLKEEIKPVMNYVKLNQQPGDVLYVYQRGEYQFKYYAEKYGYRPGDYIVGIDDLDQYDGSELSEAERRRYAEDLNQLRGHQRVWILFSHAHIDAENQMLEVHLNQIGRRIDEFHSKGAFVYLYDLSAN